MKQQGSISRHAWLKTGRWTLLVVGLLLGNLAQAATDYFFHPSSEDLPAGCEEDSGHSYSCGVLTLGEGDTITLGKSDKSDKPDKLVTITFSGAFTTGASNLINASGAVDDLKLVTNGVLTLGPNTLLNANVVGTAAVNLGSASTLAGNLTTSSPTGIVTLAADSKVGGFISSQEGAINLGANSAVGGAVSAGAGVVTLTTGIYVNGDISTVAGGITVGDQSRVCGSISSSGAGVVVLTTNIRVGGSVTTATGAITIGTGSTVGSDVISGGVITLTGLLVGGNVSSIGAGAITTTDTSIGGDVSSGAGVITLTNSQVRGTVTSGVAIVNTGSRVGDTTLIVSIPAACSGAVVGDIDHFEFSYTANALTCNPQPVTVRACLDASCSSLFVDAVSLTLSPASGWDGGNSPIINGYADLTLHVTTVSTVALVASGSPAATNATQCVVGGVVSSCDLSFVDSGFIIDVPNMLAAKPTSGTIKAVRKDAATQACVPGFASGTRTVKFSSAYANPNTGTQTVLVNGAAVGSALSDVTLSFDAAASAPLTVRYDDAGEMTLNAKFTGAGKESGLLLSGSDLFVARPAGLCVYSDSPNSDCADGDASCSALVAAGDGFRLRVRGAAWEVDSDTNFCNNGTTPNYRQTGITLTSSLIAPVPGNAGVLGEANVNIVDGDAGEKTLTNQTISEVGVFTITADPSPIDTDDPPANYLGGPPVGDSNGDGAIDKISTSANIGRFIPASFHLEDPSLTPACGISTYTGLTDQSGPPKAGQPFAFSGSLSALNRADVVTSNYTGSFAKLNGAGIAYTDPGDMGIFPASDTDVDPGQSGAGYLKYSTNALSFLFNTPRAHYDLAILTTATDSDGVTGSITDAQTSDFRLGQARIGNAQGSELQDLAVPFTAAYFTGSGYAPNPRDSCSDFTAVALGAYQRTDAGTGKPALVNAAYVVADGRGNYLLEKPVPSSSGSVSLTYAPPAWLQFDWNGDGVFDDPTGLATFGIYSGPAPLIFRRELYR
jgi:hypothetical protein